MSGKRQSCSFVLTAKARNGTDGQGEENVYIRTKGAVAPYIADGENPVACIDSNGKASSDDGYLPSARLLNGEVESNAFGESEWGSVMGEMTEYGECTAVPNGASDIWPYEWEAKRKKGTPNAASGVRVWEDYDGQMTLHERWARDAETYEIVFTEAWAKVSTSDEITARLRGYAYKVKGSTRTLLTGVTIRYGYIIDDSDTYSTTTTNNNGYFSESEWFDGDEFGPQGYNKGSKTVFAAIIVGGAVVCAYHVLMIKEAAQGQQGSTGKMCPIVGAYDPNVEYKSNSLQTVAVEVENTTTHKTELWYLTALTNVVNGVNIAPTDSNQSVWEKGLNEYNLIRTRYLFADFAQFGGAVVTGDWLISCHGTIGGVNYGGTVDNPDMYNGRAAYTYFDPAYPQGNGQADTRFIPNYALDLKTGRTYQNDAHVRGTITTVGPNSKVVISEGVAEFFGTLGFPNIVLGVDADGCAVLNFYDKNGNFKYGLGPDKIFENKSQSESMTLRYYAVDEASNDVTSIDSSDFVWLYRYMFKSETPAAQKGLYKYLAKIVARPGRLLRKPGRRPGIQREDHQVRIQQQRQVAQSGPL